MTPALPEKGLQTSFHILRKIDNVPFSPFWSAGETLRGEASMLLI